MNVFRGILGLSAGLFLGASAMAQSPMKDIDMEQVVVTATRTPKLLKDAPLVTRIITRDDIRKSDASHVGELLQSELPGIEFSFSMNQQTALNMSGFDGGSVLFLIDGERIAGETLDNVDYSRLNLNDVERIEIVKGAASALYGSNAVGGVVNIITRTDKEKWNVEANTRYGSHNEQRYGGAVSFNAGKVYSRTNVQYTDIDSYDLPADGDYSRIYGNRTWDFKERLIYTANEHLKFTARAGYFFRERDAQAIAKERYRDFSGGVKGNYVFGRHDAELAYTFDQYDKSDYNLFTEKDIRDYSNVQHTLRALYNFHIDKKYTLTTGGDFMRDYLLSYQFAENGSKSQYTADIFAQFDWNPIEKINVIAGVRYDWLSEAHLHHLSSKAGIMYKTGNCSLRGSYAGGFRAPTLKEMFMNFDMANLFMIYGNPDLKAESSHNFSLSAEYLRSGWNVAVTGFCNLVDNRISTAWDNSRNGMRYVNTSALRISGAEMYVSMKLNCGVGARLSYAYTHEHAKAGEPMISPTRPHTATLRAEYGKRWKNYSFDLILNGHWLSAVEADEYTSLTSYTQTVRRKYPAYTLWKLTLSQDIWKGIRVTLAVDNLFNYVPSYYYYNSPATTGTTFYAGVSLDIDRFFRSR